MQEAQNREVQPPSRYWRRMLVVGAAAGLVVGGLSACGSQQETTEMPRGVQLPYPESSGPATPKLLLATYNVMLQSAADDYPNAGSMEERTGRALQVLLARQPDIVAFQELNEESYGFVTAHFPGYKFWPATYDGEGHTGPRPLAYKASEFTAVGGGSYKISRYCKVSGMPSVLLESQEFGELAVLNFHPSNQGPNPNPCATEGSKKDDGSVTRLDSAKRAVAAQQAMTEGNSLPISSVVMCDCNATNHIRTNNGKDGTMSLEELPESIFEQAGLANTFRLAQERIGDEYSTVSNSITEIKSGAVEGRTRLDNIYFRPAPGMKTIVYKWENLVDASTAGISDHRPVFATVDTEPE